MSSSVKKKKNSLFGLNSDYDREAYGPYVQFPVPVQNCYFVNRIIFIHADYRCPLNLFENTKKKKIFKV